MSTSVLLVQFEAHLYFSDAFVLLTTKPYFVLTTNYCLHFIATVRKIDPNRVGQLKDFGTYVADCLPKYVEQVQIAAGDELEILVAPEGIVPTISFLKDHHNAQFENLSDITAVDVPSRTYRFEVCYNISVLTVCNYKI